MNASPPPATNRGIVGSGVKARTPRKAATSSRASGCDASCRGISSPMVCFSPARATIRPAAMAMMKAGICEARPSPMVSLVKTEMVSPKLHPLIAMPIAIPPMMLTSVMISPAIASPRTNLLAPSIAP